MDSATSRQKIEVVTSVNDSQSNGLTGLPVPGAARWGRKIEPSSNAMPAMGTDT